MDSKTSMDFPVANSNVGDTQVRIMRAEQAIAKARLRIAQAEARIAEAQAKISEADAKVSEAEATIVRLRSTRSLPAKSGGRVEKKNSSSQTEQQS